MQTVADMRGGRGRKLRKICRRTLWTAQNAFTLVQGAGKLWPTYRLVPTLFLNIPTPLISNIPLAAGSKLHTVVGVTYFPVLSLLFSLFSRCTYFSAILIIWTQFLFQKIIHQRLHCYHGCSILFLSLTNYVISFLFLLFGLYFLVYFLGCFAITVIPSYYFCLQLIMFYLFCSYFLAYFLALFSGVNLFWPYFHEAHAHSIITLKAVVLYLYDIFYKICFSFSFSHHKKFNTSVYYLRVRYFPYSLMHLI